ncbi:MAG: PEP-CTERM sorting domain-containing protein [Thiobacillus sp.]|nr:PEP-CTERM sorting domain-containing protein [Thiobacillus sp.]
MFKLIGVVLASIAFPAFAITTAPNPIPEPGALSLLGIGAVAGLLIWVKNRKK